MNSDSALETIRRIYNLKKGEILRRLKGFKQLWLNGDDEEIFAELSFCILTPQSKAKVCWDAIVRLREKGLLLKGDAKQIEKGLDGVRFKNKKAGYIVSARKFFTNNRKIYIRSLLEGFDNIHECREWLVKNISGLGCKEASHFLRNIGFGGRIAILDRHILKNLERLRIIEKTQRSITRSKYMEIEKKMKAFARQIDIPISHLDLLLWYKETGEIFK